MGYKANITVSIDLDNIDTYEEATDFIEDVKDKVDDILKEQDNIYTLRHELIN